VSNFAFVCVIDQQLTGVCAHSKLNASVIPAAAQRAYRASTGNVQLFVIGQTPYQGVAAADAMLYGASLCLPVACKAPKLPREQQGLHVSK
jgi:hypothetical protein